MKIHMIGGSGRSGTTILRKVFDRHPDFATIPEWRFMVDPDGLLDFYNTITSSWSPYLYNIKLRRLSKMLKSIGRDNYFGAATIYALRKLHMQNMIPVRLASSYSEVIFVKKYCPNYFKYVSELIENLKTFSYKGEYFGSLLFQKNRFDYAYFDDSNKIVQHIRKFYFDISDEVLRNQNKKYFLEKNTWNILWFDKILEVFPESKLVHIYRDPRDVVASFMKQTWSPSDPVKAAEFYRDIMAYWRCIKERVPSESYKEISLENLVFEEEKSLRGLCKFMNIEWSDALMDMDLTASNSGRWKKDFTKAQQREIIHILECDIKELGYTL